MRDLCGASFAQLTAGLTPWACYDPVQEDSLAPSLTGANGQAPTGEEIQIAQQLQDAEARLVVRYRERGVITKERVRSTYEGVMALFAHARVRNFLPILVERAVARELERSR